MAIESAESVYQQIERARDVLSARRVYGEPYERDGAVVIPAAIVRGGAGGGAGRKGSAEDGSGLGYAVTARPAGAWVIKDGKAKWQPATDVNRIVAGGQLLGGLALVATVWIVRRLTRGRGSDA